MMLKSQGWQAKPVYVCAGGWFIKGLAMLKELITVPSCMLGGAGKKGVRP